VSIYARSGRLYWLENEDSKHLQWVCNVTEVVGVMTNYLSGTARGVVNFTIDKGQIEYRDKYLARLDSNDPPLLVFVPHDPWDGDEPCIPLVVRIPRSEVEQITDDFNTRLHGRFVNEPVAWITTDIPAHVRALLDVRT
jgi:hypothetical protein